MNNPTISIIVPVYKAEAYLHRCVDSLLAQTFTDFEILLIDDGSPDRSGEICDEYATKDPRVRVFHKENGGVSSARQCGMDHAIGEYTIHADPDDWVEPNMLEELYRKAKEENADMVICDFINEYEGGKQRYMKQQPESLESRAVLRQLLFQQLHGSCWNKLVRRACYIKWGIRFPEEVILWEDLWVNCELLCNSLKVTYLPQAFYHYDLSINVNSIVRKVTRKGVDSQIIFCNHFEQLFQNGDYGVDPAWLYICKAATKELMYHSRLCTNEEIIQAFEEINEQYIVDNQYIRSCKFIVSLKYRLALVLRNKNVLEKVLTLLSEVILFIKKCVI